MACQLRQVFGYSFEEFWFEVPLDRAHAEQAWAVENDAVTRCFGSIKPVGKRYIGTQVEEMMKQIK
jgi:hypothetical protein